MARYNQGLNRNKKIKDPYNWSSSTIVSILKKQEYLGHTVNFKTQKHFKDKKSLYVSQDNWVIFEDTQEPIKGAKFKLYKGQELLGIYETNDEGNINITDLFQYESIRDVNQDYLLSEIYAPEGYVLTDDISFKVEKQNGNLTLIENSESNENVHEYTANNDTVYLTVEDSPSFVLIKKDG